MQSLAAALDFDFTVVDGLGPLATDTDELWSAFPFARAAVSPMELWLLPQTAVAAVVLYLLSIPFFKFICETVLAPGPKEQERRWKALYDASRAEKERRVENAKDERARSKAKSDLSAFNFEAFKANAAPGFNGSKSPTFSFLVALHNVILVVFSATVFVKATPVVFGVAQEKGWRAAYCDADKSMWNNTTFGYWATVFYLSKFYEFIDTWVLVAKCSSNDGKRVVPSTLQVYHHAGIALTMWGSTVTQGAWIAWVVVMNSGVHTIMYTYFLAATFGYKSPLARHLTALQLAQFFTGIVGTLAVHALGASCDSDASRTVLACLQIYAVGLIVLFGIFYTKKYKSDKKD